jgi:hypothetical protein
MRGFLLHKFFLAALQLFFNPLDLLLRGGALRIIQLHSRRPG